MLTLVGAGGILLVTFILGFFALDQASSIMSNWYGLVHYCRSNEKCLFCILRGRWLSYWSDKQDDDDGNVWYYLGIYAGIGAANSIFVLIRYAA